MFWSTVMRISKPAASVASRRLPFFKPASLAKRAVWQSCSGNRSRSRSSTHSSIRSRINRVPAAVVWLLPTPAVLEREELSGIPPENLPACRPPPDNRTESARAPESRGTREHRASSPDLLRSLAPRPYCLATGRILCNLCQWGHQVRLLAAFDLPDGILRGAGEIDGRYQTEPAAGWGCALGFGCERAQSGQILPIAEIADGAKGR